MLLRRKHDKDDPAMEVDAGRLPEVGPHPGDGGTAKAGPSDRTDAGSRLDDEPIPSHDERPADGAAPFGPVQPEPAPGEGAQGSGHEPPVPMWQDAPSRAPSIGNLRPETMPLLAATNRHRLPMCVADGGRLGSWWLSAASIVGTSHVATGTTRQDDYTYTLLSDGSLLAVVTDGLGSYKDTAQIGAGLMARAVIEVAHGLFVDIGRSGSDEGDLLRRSVLEAEPLVTALGEKLHALRAEQLSCTLVACRLTVGGTAQFVRVGDAEAFMCSSGSAGFESVFADDEDAFINVVSGTCPQADAGQVEVATRPTDGRVLLASDGLAADVRNSKALRSYLSDAWDRPVSAALALETLRYRRQGSHDDRTALVTWLVDSEHESSPPGPQNPQPVA